MAVSVTDFIGREGSGLSKLRSNIPGENQNNPNLLSDEDLLRQISVANEIQNTRGLNPTEAQALSGLMEAQKFRQGQQQNMANQQLDSIFGPGGNSGGDTSSFNPTQYNQGLQDSAAKQREALNNVFGARRTSGLQGLTDLYAKQRGQTIDEQGALGSRLLSGSGQAAIQGIDAQKNKAMADYLTSLEGEQGGALANLEGNLGTQQAQGQQFAANLGQQGRQLSLQEKLGRAGLLQSGNQFGQTMGLEKQKFAEQQRQSALDQLFNQESLNQAGELGRRQASADTGGGFLGGAGQGAAAGSVFGPWGAVIGGIGGGIAGELKSREKKNKFASNYSSVNV